jgi:aspartate/methionine/tyrosine aminotransferase
MSSLTSTAALGPDLVPAPRRGDGGPLALAPACVDASAMTLLERDCYLDRGPGDVNVTHGYPEGLSPRWIREYQEHLPRGWLDIPPADYVTAISRYFTRLLNVDEVRLTPTCTMAFTIAAQAVARPGDEVIVTDRSYDSWPALLRALGARVVFTRRAAGGAPDAADIAAACTARTRAVVIVSPDNPLGVVCSAEVLGQVAGVCRERGLTLIVDHCLAELNPYGRQIPLLPRVAGRGLSWIAVADTGKLLGLNGSKVSALACSASWREAIGAAASAWFFQYSQYDLALLAAVLSDPRFAAYRLELSARIAAGHGYLRSQVPGPMHVGPVGAGCFALVDAAGLRLDDLTLASLLRDRYRVLTVPVSWFPSGRPARETRVRVSLSRRPDVIERLAAALNALASSR